MKAIFAVMKMTRAIVRIRPAINSGLYVIENHDLCNTGPDYIIHHFMGLFGTNKMTSSQLAC